MYIESDYLHGLSTTTTSNSIFSTSSSINSIVVDTESRSKSSSSSSSSSVIKVKNNTTNTTTNILGGRRKQLNKTITNNIIDPQQQRHQDRSSKIENNNRIVEKIYYINLQHYTRRKDRQEAWLSQLHRTTGIPYARIEAQHGDPNTVCDDPNGVRPKGSARCMGIDGVLKSNLGIIDIYLNATTTTTTTTTTTSVHNNKSDTTTEDDRDRDRDHGDDHGQQRRHPILVVEDDYELYNITKLEETITEFVPKDYDVIRWGCWGAIPKEFPWVNHHVFRTSCVGKSTSSSSSNSSRSNQQQQQQSSSTCSTWFCGGNHATLWSGTPDMLTKLRTVWTPKEAQSSPDCLLTNAEASLISYCVNNIPGIGGLFQIKQELSAVSQASS